MTKRYLLWALLGAVTVGLTHTGTSVGFKGGDWAAWVGAIGTIGALVGTIHLARTETRRRERNERTIARLHGASMSPRVEDALIVVARVATMLHLARTGERDPAYYGQCAAELTNAEFWSIDEITPLAPLPFNTAIKLAETVALVHSAERTLKLMADHHNISSQEQREQVEGLSMLIRRAVKNLNEAGRECRLGSVELQLNMH